MGFRRILRLARLSIPLLTMSTTAAEQELLNASSPAPFKLLGAEVPVGTFARLAWAPSQAFEGVNSPTPVLVVNGTEPGPTLCLTAAVHGDELNGVEVVRRVLYGLTAKALKGTVIGVPIVNLQGFHRRSRYLLDRRDLNRFFPGNLEGSSASRMAYSFFQSLVKHCTALVDIHTGSFYRTNLPQLRADLTLPEVVKMTKGFGPLVILHSVGSEGTLRRAAVAAGIPAVTLEAGGPMVLDETVVKQAARNIRSLLNSMEMVNKFQLGGEPEPVYYNSAWERAQEGGILFSKVKLGAFVTKGDLLGTVTNPVTNVRSEIRSTHTGRVLGMVFNQVVQSGFAAYHIGIETPQPSSSLPEPETGPLAEKDKAGDGWSGDQMSGVREGAEATNLQPSDAAVAGINGSYTNAEFGD